jgi:hypothetical protein
MSEELIKLLTEEIGRYGVQCSETKELAPPKSLTDLLSALAAQQSQEPVAKVKRNSGVNGREFVGETLEFRDLPVGTRLYTAPASGVQERIALQELRNIVNAKRFDVEVFDDDTAFADWAQSRARHAITRAADRVNTEPAVQAPLAKKHENMRISLNGMLGRIARGATVEDHHRYAIGEFLKHCEELAKRFYSGDMYVIDEFLQLYCLDEHRPTERAAQEGK